MAAGKKPQACCVSRYGMGIQGCPGMGTESGTNGEAVIAGGQTGRQVVQTENELQQDLQAESPDQEDIEEERRWDKAEYRVTHKAGAEGPVVL